MPSFPRELLPVRYIRVGIWKYRSIANRVGLGQHEAHELRDGDKGKWLGKGELKKQKKKQSNNQFNRLETNCIR